MKKEIITADYNRIKELSYPHFNRMCPKAGSERQRIEQETLFLQILECYDEFLCPNITCTIYKDVERKQGILFLEKHRIDCSGMFPENLNPDIKSVIGYGISLPDIKTGDDTDLLESFFLDCWMTALIDGTRDWLKEYLKMKADEANEAVSDAFGPGFFGIGMESLPDVLEMTDAENIGIGIFHGSLYPPKSNVGFYLVYTVQKDSKTGDFKTGDCHNCLSGGKNCLFCKNYKQETK